MKQLLQIGRVSIGTNSDDPYYFDEPLCKHSDPEAWFDEHHESSHKKLAISICHTCKHQVECAAYAIVRPDIVGIWGGTTSSDRKRIRKENGITGIPTSIDFDDDVITS